MVCLQIATHPGFLSRHLLAAVTTIYIDVLHDADIGVSPEISDKKLADIPYVIKTFQRAERSDASSSREVGRRETGFMCQDPADSFFQMGMRGRLLIQALEDAKEARRKTGGGSRQDYGRVLKVSLLCIFRKRHTKRKVLEYQEIAANVKRSSTSVTPASLASSSPILPPTASINWLDDPETRKLLSSLGLLDAGGQWQPTNMSMAPQVANDNNPMNITTSLDFANTFNTGFDLLDSYTF